MSPEIYSAAELRAGVLRTSPTLFPTTELCARCGGTLWISVHRTPLGDDPFACCETCARVERAWRCVCLLDDRHPPTDPRRTRFTVCGFEVSPVEPDGQPPPGGAPDFETTRDPDEVTCLECRAGPDGYTWYRVVCLNPGPCTCSGGHDLEGTAMHTPQEAWNAFFPFEYDAAEAAALRDCCSPVVIQATTRRAVEEAQPRSPHSAAGQSIGRGRWQRSDWQPPKLWPMVR